MAVSFDAVVVPRMWRGYDDPGLPVGAWIAHGVSAGDLSAGANEIIMIFKAAGAPADGRFYNIEQINYFHTNAVEDRVWFRAINFDSLGPFIVGERDWVAELDANTVNNASGRLDRANLTPLFLGQTNRLASLASTFVVSFLNRNLISVSAVAQGYIWEPRSVMAPGGLRRPLDSLYG